MRVFNGVTGKSIGTSVLLADTPKRGDAIQHAGFCYTVTDILPDTNKIYVRPGVETLAAMVDMMLLHLERNGSIRQEQA